MNKTIILKENSILYPIAAIKKSVEEMREGKLPSTYFLNKIDSYTDLIKEEILKSEEK